MVKIACFMKEGFPWIEQYLKKNFDALIIKNDDDYHYQKRFWTGTHDYVISFLSPWILPKNILDSATKKAINFHPAPPKYPGSAGYNLAIYNQEKQWGVTCHEMHEKVDSGPIYRVKYFYLNGNETVAELRHRSHIVLEALFYEVMEKLEYYTSGDGMPWECEPHKFDELEHLCDCTGITDPKELALRMRACTFPGAKNYPFIKIDFKKYKLEEINDRNNDEHVSFNESSTTESYWGTAPFYSWISTEFTERECESNRSDD